MTERIDIGPGIEKAAGVVGGDACIRHTRILVWGLAGYRRLGLSDAQLLENFPTLKAIDLANAWAYVAAHHDEIEQLFVKMKRRNNEKRCGSSQDTTMDEGGNGYYGVNKWLQMDCLILRTNFFRPVAT